MADPVIIREPLQHQEVYTGGDITGIMTKITMRHGETPIVVETVWQIPEDEWMTAEYWNNNKRNLGSSFVVRAVAETNIEYAAYQALKAYLDGLSA